MPYIFRIFNPLRPAKAPLAIAALAVTTIFASGALWAQSSVPESRPITAEENTDAPEPPAYLFTLADVEKQAANLAAKPFVKPNAGLINALSELTEDEWGKISFNENKGLWAEDHLPFTAEFFHPGFIYNQPPEIFIIDPSGARPFKFFTDFFQYPEADLKNKAAKSGKNFAGFRLKYPLNNAERKDEVLSFIGATHFRALARHARYGLEARGLILNPASPEGEEFPYFRRFWLERPAEDADSLTVFALLDSPSLTGAYRFIITPGSSTVMDVSVTLFKREGRPWPEKVGLAPLGSMYLFSEKDRNIDDWRPEAHNSDSLLWAVADGLWHYRPLANPKRLEGNHFELNRPGGYGLMQRDADFDHYQDLDARFDLRPSLWVEPTGDWGPGRLELIEIPAARENNNNIISFWTPDHLPEKVLSYGYKLYWLPAGSTPHQIGRVAATRQSRAADGLIEYIVDFEGGPLNDIPAESGLSSAVETSPEVAVIDKSLAKNQVTGGWRLRFKIKPPESGMVENLMAVRNGQKSLRIQARLKKGENLAEPLTETWVYDLGY